MMLTLSNSFATIMNEGELETTVVQVLDAKVIRRDGSNESHRILMSDGAHLGYAILDIRPTFLLEIGLMRKNSIIKILKYKVITENVPGKGDERVMVIEDLRILRPGSSLLNLSTSTNDTGNFSNFTDDESFFTDDESFFTEDESFFDEEGLFDGFDETITTPDFSFCSQPIYDSHSPINTNNIHAISSLTSSSRYWTIKARVNNKSCIWTWDNNSGSGKLFSIDLVDESGEIKATAFNMYTDMFYPLFEVNKVYYISGGMINNAHETFRVLNNKFEINLSHRTKILPCTDSDLSTIPTLHYKFQTLQSIKAVPRDHVVDFIGVVSACSGVDDVFSLDKGCLYKLRKLQIVDQTMNSITLNLWGNQSEYFCGNGNPVVAVRGARVVDYQGVRSVALLVASTFNINPDLPKAHELRNWFDHLPDNVQFFPIT